MYQVISDVLERSAKQFANRDALCVAGAGDKAISYSQLQTSVHHGIDFLRKNGVERGTPVILLSESGPQWLTMFFAIVGAGGVVIPLMESIPQPNLQFIAGFSKAQVVLTSERLVLRQESF